MPSRCQATIWTYRNQYLQSHSVNGPQWFNMSAAQNVPRCFTASFLDLVPHLLETGLNPHKTALSMVYFRVSKTFLLYLLGSEAKVYCPPPPPPPPPPPQIMFNWRRPILTSFINLLKVRRPKWIFWCSGLFLALTHWGQDKMATMSQTALSNVFSWMKILEFRLRFQWILFLRFDSTIFYHWLR